MYLAHFSMSYILRFRIQNLYSLLSLIKHRFVSESLRERKKNEWKKRTYPIDVKDQSFH